MHRYAGLLYHRFAQYKKYPFDDILHIFIRQKGWGLPPRFILL